jgi:CPA2 family monovalent cation:H+ antiporter-2
MPHASSLIALLSAGLVLAFVLGALAHRIKLSPLVGYLLAGMLVGPFTPGFVGDLNVALQLADIGVVLLMFGVGLHFSVEDLKAVRRLAPFAVLPMAFATLLGWGLARFIGWSSWQGVVFGLCLSVASTVVLMRALETHRLVDTERGKAAIGWMIVEDLVTIVALVLLPVLARALGDGSGPMPTAKVAEALALTMGKLLVFGALILLVGRRVVPWLLRKIAGTGSRELFTLAILAIALGMAFGSAELFGVSIALGAFFAGMLLNESELSHKAAADSLPMRDAFAVLFFVSVGMLFNPNILVREPLLVLATFLVITVGKPAAAFVLVRAIGQPARMASTIGATVSQIGEFSFILSGLAVALKILPPEGRDLVLAAALLSIVANPIIFHWVVAWQKREKAERKAQSEARADAEAPAGPPLPTAGHTIVVGYGRVGAQLARLLKERGVDVVVIDDSRDLIDRAHADGISAVRGNAASAERLAELAPETASRALLAIPNAFEAGEIIARLRKANPAMSILARAHSEPEMRHLLAQGADGAVLAERELAYSMAEMVLGR